jgi:hypothetical protein
VECWQVNWKGSSKVKVDLHVHTQERSPCARASEDEQIQAAIAAGLDAIFITSQMPSKCIHPIHRQQRRMKSVPLLAGWGFHCLVTRMPIPPRE